ncbi:MAG: TfoX/Sxy family protein [Caldilineaceae bacterium]|nr:TfoX/Sxy family protein [Caldilineaceae bacterium]
MSDEREFVDYLLELLAPVDGVTAKRMFGGFGLFRHGLMFGLVADSVLYFKVDEANLADFEAVGAEPFLYDKGGKSVAMSYYTAPGEALDNSDDMQEWAAIAYQAAVRAAAKKKPKRKKS